MAAASRRRQSEPVLPYSSRFHHAPPPHNFASSSSGFSVRTPTAGFFHRSASPSDPRSAAVSVRFSLDRSASSSGGCLSASGGHVAVPARVQKRTCMCSPTNHPGSFRCSLHKSSGSNSGRGGSSYSPNRLNARRSAMTNSLVRIGGVEGDLVKRALAALIRPSSHQQRRRNGFRPRPSRLSAMTRAEDL